MQRISCLIAVLLLTASCSSTPTAPPPQPFKSTPAEEKNVDRLLARWEQWNASLKTFDCRFKRWTYDTVFGPKDQPRFVELGMLMYAAPDKWRFQVDKADQDAREVPIDPRRADHWSFDGKSIIEYDHVKKQVIEHKLPANLQGKRLVDGPLTFPVYGTGLFWLGLAMPEPGTPVPFSAKAEDLKHQYYLREITPPTKPHDEIWLEAYPRSARLAGCFQRLQLIFRATDMSPYALKIVQPDGKTCTVYQFYDIAINTADNSPPLLDSHPFRPAVPHGWRKIVAEPPPAS